VIPKPLQVGKAEAIISFSVDVPCAAAIWYSGCCKSRPEILGLGLVRWCPQVGITWLVIYQLALGSSQVSVFISFPQGLFNTTRDEEGVEDNGWTAGRSGQVWNWMLCDKARSH
jgi:hypothetical protein